jgi:hypothetical protein
VVGGDGIGDLLEDRGFAGARRCDDEAAGALADGGDQVDDRASRRSGVVSRRNFSIGSMVVRFSNRTDLTNSLNGMPLTLTTSRNCGLTPRCGRLEAAFDLAAFAEEMAFDGVRRDEDVRGTRLIAVVGDRRKPKPFSETSRSRSRTPARSHLRCS